MADVHGKTAHCRARRVTGRYFLRASRASQIKNPIVKIAKPMNAISCCTLARASEIPVCASMVWFLIQPITVRITFMASSKPKTVRLMTATPNIILTPSNALISV
jgi:sulfur transfer protein SufE